MSNLVHLDETAFYVDDLLTRVECQSYISRAEELGFAQATIMSGGKQIVANEIRNNDRVIIDSDDIAETLWQKVRTHIPAELDGERALGLNERFRFYRYKPKQLFRLHKDFPHAREGKKSKLSLIIYLNDDFEGGVTAFRKFEIQPKTGRAAVFRHDLLHEGGTVRSGVKYAVRTDVMYTNSI